MTAAEVALDKQDWLQPLVTAMQNERERLFTALQQIQWLEPAPSAANFFAVKTAIAPKELFTQLHTRGILIRDVSSAPMLNDYVRISVGTPEENDALLVALREICTTR
jgi:histidinol-phosphate aminotransferase